MQSSLIPERPLLISPTLAATIGLEEAVMLHVFSELLHRHPLINRAGRTWAELDDNTLREAMPFWQAQDIRRIRKSLQDLGILLAEPVANKDNTCLFAIKQNTETAQSPTAAAFPGPAPAAPEPESAGKASLIPPHWQPGEDLIRHCQQHNIPRDFILQRVKSFVIYWRERQKAQYSWHHTFLKFIIKEWRSEQSYQGAKELETNMSADWSPSEDAVTILEHAGINRSFIEDSIPEFVLYWRERGLVTSTWNTKFIAHVRRQWARFTLAVENDSMPRPISADYQPSEACYDVLALANIDLDFARAQVKEFVLYWLDSKQAQQSWNTKFLQHVKYKWANQHHDDLPVHQQISSTLERFTDRSWAD